MNKSKMKNLILLLAVVLVSTSCGPIYDIPEGFDRYSFVHKKENKYVSLSAFLLRRYPNPDKKGYSSISILVSMNNLTNDDIYIGCRGKNFPITYPAKVLIGNKAYDIRLPGKDFKHQTRALWHDEKFRYYETKYSIFMISVPDKVADDLCSGKQAGELLIEIRCLGINKHIYELHRPFELKSSIQVK